MTSANKYKKYLYEAGLFESPVVMIPPDTLEGNTAVDEVATPEVTQWWKENVGNQDEQAYTKHLIERFDKDSALKILIVVDKLLKIGRASCRERVKSGGGGGWGRRERAGAMGAGARRQ